jgi:hypothetical protein
MFFDDVNEIRGIDCPVHSEALNSLRFTSDGAPTRGPEGCECSDEKVFADCAEQSPTFAKATSQPAPKPRKTNIADIRRFLDLVMVPDGVVEVRALEVLYRGTVTGYFDHKHPKDATDAIASLSGEAEGVYLTLNPVDKDLLARSAKCTSKEGHAARPVHQR